MEEIPLTFQTVEHYLSFFGYPLLEETRCELASSMEIIHKSPFAEISSFRKNKGNKEILYDVTVDSWKNRCSERGKEPYRTLPGDLILLANGRPESIFDLQRRTWVFALVSKIPDKDIEDDSTSKYFEVKASQDIEFQDGMFVVFLMNITTHKRIWNSLHMNGNSSIIKEVLNSDSMVRNELKLPSLLTC